eukprot:m.361191 g.361191  ORF g.361191 m.361191 type:complete len:62 (+) comp19401_c0_seq1:1038-1223(+)
MLCAIIHAIAVTLVHACTGAASHQHEQTNNASSFVKLLDINVLLICSCARLWLLSIEGLKQ